MVIEGDDIGISKKESVLGELRKNALIVYVVFFIAVNFTGMSFLSESVWAPYVTQNTAAPSGSMWVEGESIHWADGEYEYYFSENEMDLVETDVAGDTGSVWVDGTDLYWVDAYGDKRRFTGDNRGGVSGSIGSAWMENSGLTYIDESQEKRKIDMSFGEAGYMTGLSNDEWKYQGFSTEFAAKPVVFATTQTTNGGQDPSAAHVRNVDRSGFDTQHCEWDGGDICDTHNDETNGWLALDIDRVNALPGFEAGSMVMAEGSEVSQTVNFASSFSSTPLVFGQIQSEHYSDNKPYNVRAKSVSTSSFDLEFCQQQTSNDCGQHGEEVAAWLAIDPDTADDYGIMDWGKESVTDSGWVSVSFDTNFDSAPAVIALVQTKNGGSQAVYPEADNVDTSGADIRYCESDGDNDCDTHATEEVAWLAVERGALHH